jgi:hypothetical protein
MGRHIIVAAVFVIAAALWIINAPSRETSGAGIVGAAAQTFETRVKQLQQGSSNQYIPVAIPSYFGQENLWTESRLYRSRLAFFANMRDPRKDTLWWKGLEGMGQLSTDGSGPIFEFDDLNPCSELKQQITNTSTIYDKITGKACLIQNSIEINIQMQAETRGTGTDQMKQAGHCRMLPNGHCDLFTNPQSKFAKFLVLPK